MKKKIKRSIVLLLFLLLAYGTSAQNPIITDQFTADPSARVFGDRIYVYPSHDIPCTEGKGRIGWFCMEDYHVFSSTDLKDWRDHGVIVRQNKVDWADPNGYSMWAPDCVFNNGKYYFYFPTRAKDTTRYGSGFSVGVAVANQPYGPFIPQSVPIKNVDGIDPNVFIDKDGTPYLYWSKQDLFVARLKDNMLDLDAGPLVIANLPEKGLKEGPYMFERNGVYYLTYPHVENKTERLEYAMGDNPLGPFKVTGVIMDESPTGCWTNHHSVIEFKGQWYLFYHHNDLSPNFDKNRSVRIDSLSFNEDGTIQKVIPTLRGIGLAEATQKIQIDRYSDKSDDGVSIIFLDTLNRFEGWKSVFTNPNAWIKYNSVNFDSDHKFKSVNVKALSGTGGTLQFRLNRMDGPVIAQVGLLKGNTWKTIKAPVSPFQTGIYDLFVVLEDGAHVEIDWVSFE